MSERTIPYSHPAYRVMCKAVALGSVRGPYTSIEDGISHLSIGDVVAEILGSKEFDRWLNSVKAEAWGEGESAGEHNAGNGLASLLSGVEPPPPTENPYRTGGAE